MLPQPLNQDEHPYPMDKIVLIKTVTFYYVGKLVEVWPGELVLEKGASWAADTGKYEDAMTTGKFSEVEPFHPDKRVVINRDALVDCQEMSEDIDLENLSDRA
jgi:hypothetical protein